MAAVAIRGTTYPVVLPKLRDRRLHLAATITSLQVLGQVAFHFRLSIAQILISLGTVALIEVAITVRRQHVLMWPASALLTGNGVAFVLRVPGTQHGDWWTTRGWWIFVAVSGRLAALEVRDRVARRARLQPVEHRARRRVPRARPDARRAARLLVGADVVVDGADARDHRDRRLRDPPAAEAAARRAVVLGGVRRGDRRGRGCRAHDDRAVAPRPDRRALVLVGARHLARGPRLLLLHDHRPEDGAARPARRVFYGSALGLLAARADRADDDGVRGEGGAALVARRRLRSRRRSR